MLLLLLKILSKLTNPVKKSLQFLNKNSIHKRLISLDKRDDFIAKDNKIAICGIHIGGDAIHVGIYWNSENEKKIFHFQNGNNIPIVDATHIDFQGYFFNPINDFPENLLPSLAAFSELISENKINNLIFFVTDTTHNGKSLERNILSNSKTIFTFYPGFFSFCMCLDFLF